MQNYYTGVHPSKVIPFIIYQYYHCFSMTWTLQMQEIIPAKEIRRLYLINQQTPPESL